MRSRHLITIAIALIAATVPATVAGADEGVAATRSADGGTIEASTGPTSGAREEQRVGTRGGGVSPYSGCVVRDHANAVASGLGQLLTGAGASAVVFHGGAGVRICTRRDGSGDDVTLVGPGAPAAPAPPAADDVARSAAAQLALAVPEVATSPPLGGTQLVGVAVWFWVAGSGAESATATVPGLSATLEAEPAGTRFELDDGTVLRCDGTGTPYDPERPSVDQRSACSHAFDRAGPVRVRATVEWALRWTASDGQRGTLPNVSRTTALSLTIEEAQAVTD
jgi:hypothetical protein